jgi:glycosyltransferase involved in cell wall biosynthesis
VVALIDNPPVAGGAERVATDISTHLDPERFEPTLCVSRWDGWGLPAERMDVLRREIEEPGVRVLALDRRSTADLRAWLPLLRLLRAQRVDVLHGHMFGSNVWACVLGRLAGVPVVVAHEHTGSYEVQPVRKALDRHLIARLSDSVLAVSSQIRRRMLEVEGIAPRDVELVGNGITPPPAPSGADVRAELGIPVGAPVIGVVAVQRPEKALDVLLRAAAVLEPRHPGLQVLFAGGGFPDERARLAALVDELGVGDAVRFLGTRRDVPDVLRALDVAVCCSRFEGSPLSVMEYMAAGLPIVATRVGGVPDLIEDGRDGLLVDAGDHEALAAAVDRVLRDRALAGRLGDSARRRQAAEFDIAKTVRRVEGIYDRLLTRRGRGLRVEALARDLPAARADWDDLARAAGTPFAMHAPGLPQARRLPRGHPPAVHIARGAPAGHAVHRPRTR